MNKKTPLLTELLKYHKEENIIFSMPGNKCGKAFERDIVGKEFVENLGYLDITEVDPLDNLHNPEGVINEAQELLANYYGVKKAYFMVNGSSGANLTAIFSAFNEGDEILVERNCHKSIYNAILLRKLIVTYIEPVVLGENGLFLPPDKEKIYEAINKSENPKGIILTYPNYYGISYDISDIIYNLQKRGLKVVIDAAHGAHYGVTTKLPMNISKIADYTVVSAHKTIPALTGGSYLLVNVSDENLQFYISAFMTTSPSYLIMASLDYARYYLENFGEKDYEELIEMAELMKEKINDLDKIKILSNSDLPCGYQIDLSRYVLILPSGYSGNKLLEYLRQENIQCEMSFYRGVVLILSPVNYKSGLQKLYYSLQKLDIETIKSKNLNSSFKFINPKKAMEPYKVFEYKGIWCNLENSINKVVKESIVPYPPGIPIISSGEILSEKIVENIKRYIENDVDLIGINDGKVKIIDL